MSKDEKMIINLPGPPKEMKYVVDHVLKDYLMQYKKDVIYTYDILTIGIGESKIDELLEDMIYHQDEISIALYASEETVRIRLGCKASNQQVADDKVKTIKEKIELLVGDYIIKEVHLKDALAKIMPSYVIQYECDNFRLRDDFNLGNNCTKDILTIEVDCIKHRLGAIIKIKFDYLGNEDSFEVPLLKDPTLSYSKLESKIISKLYQFLTK